MTDIMLSKNRTAQDFVSAVSELETRALWSDAETLLHTAVNEFPDEKIFRAELIYVSFQLIRRSPSDKKRACEAIAEGEALLAEISDLKLHCSVERSLCFIYSVTGDQEMAKRHYDALPTIDCCRELYAAYVTEGEALKAELQKNVENYIACAATSARQLGMRESGERACALLLKSVELYELLYEDGDYGVYACDMAMSCLDIAQVKMTLGKPDEALDMLERAARYAAAYPDAPDSPHTSVLADRVSVCGEFVPRGRRVSEIVRDTIKLSSDFAPLRSNSRFKALLAI
ncbi:MAG: hypothetical protein WCQ72_02535 [Eubacteriales bacterium]